MMRWYKHLKMDFSACWKSFEYIQTSNIDLFRIYPSLLFCN